MLFLYLLHIMMILLQIQMLLLQTKFIYEIFAL